MSYVHELEAVVQKLEARGLTENAAHLRALDEQVHELERPPGLFNKVRSSIKVKAKEQWTHVAAELKESREAWGLIRKRLGGKEKLTPEQAALVQSQLLDIFRVVPASSIAIANAALPIPGTGLFTPWILMKLGLMPSRWREAYTLKKLEQEYEELKLQGAMDEAHDLKRIMEAIERDAESREMLRDQCQLLTLWDANGNGIWDDDELEAYKQAVIKMRKKKVKKASKKLWYFLLHQQVFGPAALTEVKEHDPGLPIFVCYKGKSGWVVLDDVLSDDEITGMTEIYHE